MTTLTFLRSNSQWLLAGAVLTFLSSFGQTFFISLFASKIMDSFSLSHGEWGGIYTIGTTASAVVMVWAGGLTDRYRVRALGAVVLILLMLACLFMAFNRAVWLLPLVIFALRFTGQGMTSHIALVAMSRWFVATRGKALSVATLGFSVGEALLPIIFVSLMAMYDWRILWIAAGIIALCGIPALFGLLRQERTPQSLAQSSQVAGMSAHHWTRMNAIRHYLFWMMLPALLGPSAFNTAFFFHHEYFASVKGIAHLDFVKMFPFYTLVSVFSLVISGFAIDRWGTPRLLPFFQLPMVAGFILFAYADGPGMLFVGLFFLGLTTGANSTLPNAFWAEFYGTRHLGSIKALATATMVLGSAIGPWVIGMGIDAKIGIEVLYLLVAGYFVFCSLMMLIGVLRAKRLLLATA